MIGIMQMTNPTSYQLRNSHSCPRSSSEHHTSGSRNSLRKTSIFSFLKVFLLIYTNSFLKVFLLIYTNGSRKAETGSNSYFQETNTLHLGSGYIRLLFSRLDVIIHFELFLKVLDSHYCLFCFNFMAFLPTCKLYCCRFARASTYGYQDRRACILQTAS